MTLPTIDQLTQTWETPDTGVPASYGEAIAAEEADVTRVQAALAAKQQKLVEARARLAEEQARLDRLLGQTPTGSGAGLAERIRRAQVAVDHWAGRIAELEGRVENRETALARQQGEVQGAQNRLDFYSNVRTLMPYLPPELAQLYADVWAGNAGNPACSTLNASNSWIAGSSSTIRIFALIIAQPLSNGMARV